MSVMTDDDCACDSDVACSVAGITSDANVLTNQLRLFSQRHLLHYGEPIPCEQLVASLCDIKQAYTQFGGMCFKVMDTCSALSVKFNNVVSCLGLCTLNFVSSK